MIVNGTRWRRYVVDGQIGEPMGPSPDQPQPQQRPLPSQKPPRSPPSNRPIHIITPSQGTVSPAPTNDSTIPTNVKLKNKKDIQMPKLKQDRPVYALGNGRATRSPPRYVREHFMPDERILTIGPQSAPAVATVKGKQENGQNKSGGGSPTVSDEEAVKLTMGGSVPVALQGGGNKPQALQSAKELNAPQLLHDLYGNTVQTTAISEVETSNPLNDSTGYTAGIQSGLIHSGTKLNLGAGKYLPNPNVPKPSAYTLGTWLISKLGLGKNKKNYSTKKITIYNSELEALGDLGSPIDAIGNEDDAKKSDNVVAEAEIKVPNGKEFGKAATRGLIEGVTGIIDAPILAYELATDSTARRGFVKGVKQMPKEFSEDPTGTSIEFLTSLLGGYAAANVAGRVANIAKANAEMRFSKNYMPPEETGVEFKPTYTDPIEPDELIKKFAGTKQTTIHVTNAKEFDDWLKSNAPPKVLKGFPDKATGFRKRYDLLHFYKSLPTDEGNPQAYLTYAGIGKEGSTTVTKLTFTRPKIKALIFPDEEITHIPPEPGEDLAQYSARVGQMSGKTLIPPENVFGLSTERQVITPAQFEGNLGKYPGSVIEKTRDLGFTYYVEEPDGILGKIPGLRTLGRRYHKINLIEAKTKPIEGTEGETISTGENLGKNVIDLGKYSSEYGRTSYVGVVDDILPSAILALGGASNIVLSNERSSRTKSSTASGGTSGISMLSSSNSGRGSTGKSWFTTPHPGILSEFSHGSKGPGSGGSNEGFGGSKGTGGGGSEGNDNGGEPPYIPPYHPPKPPHKEPHEPPYRKPPVPPPYIPPFKPPHKEPHWPQYHEPPYIPPYHPPRPPQPPSPAPPYNEPSNSPTTTTFDLPSSTVSTVSSSPLIEIGGHVRSKRLPRRRSKGVKIPPILDNPEWNSKTRKNKNKIFTFKPPKISVLPSRTSTKRSTKKAPHRKSRAHRSKKRKR